MKSILFGKESETIKKLVEQKGITILESAQNEKPDIVISYGGDGTLILSESQYPGIPKIALRNSAVCKMCSSKSNEAVLDALVAGDYAIREIEKLSVSVGEKNLYAINDIIVHNANPRHAIRYTVSVNNEQIPNHEVIGDGLIIATPFGSSGYYRSITDGIFTVGIGIAFNNSTEQSDHMVLDDSVTITIKITRGPAVVFADNQPEEINVNVGDKITIQQSKTLAKIITI